MNIIKSKYTLEQLKDIYEEMENKTDYKLFNKICFIATFIVNIPYFFWIIFLGYGIFVESIYCLVSLLFAIIGAIISRFEMDIAFSLMERQFKKGRHFFNVFDITILPDIMKNIECCEKLLELQESGTLSLLKKGKSQIVLYTGKDGKEELFPLSCEVSVIDSDTLDFSCHDEKIDTILTIDDLLWEKS